MIHLNEKDILSILDVSLDSSVEFSGIATDTRQVKPGNLFVTWKGERHDGHQFCQKAVELGAAVLLVSRQVDSAKPQIIVSDTIKALGKLASYWRSRFDLPVIAITGSNGKTTTKNMLRAILIESYNPKTILAPEKSFNNHVGVPLTLSQLNEHHKAAVIEMGMNHFTEIDYLTNMARPSVAMITNAAESHLAGLGDVKGVAKAKGEIFNGLQSGGTAILNADDAHFTYWKGLVKHDVLTFGIENTADIMANNISINSSGSSFELQTPAGKVTINLPLLGLHNVMNALSAAACAVAIKIDLTPIKKGLECVKPESRRLEIKASSKGAVVIDDSYNANPNSLYKAIDVLKQFSGKKILVIGEMRELGEQEASFHRLAGQYAKEHQVDYVYAYGRLTQALTDQFGPGAENYEDKQSLIERLSQLDQHKTTFLVKGSNSTGMDEVVAKL